MTHRLNVISTSNESETTSTVGVWETFPYPSPDPYIIVKNIGDIDISTTETKFTYTGTSPVLFLVFLDCDIAKSITWTADRMIEFQFFKNSTTPCGLPRRFWLSGEGEKSFSALLNVEMSNGDYLEPKIRNLDDDNTHIVRYSDFLFMEEY